MKVNFFSFKCNRFHTVAAVICIASALVLSACYSFTGGAVPPHLNTLYIPAVVDQSGFGNPEFRNHLAQLLVDKFRNDNSLRLVDEAGDARLNVTLRSITLTPVAVRQGEVASENRAQVAVEAEYYDAVQKKLIWKKTFSNYDQYVIAEGLGARDRAIQKAIDRTTDDILLEVVSGW